MMAVGVGMGVICPTVGIVVGKDAAVGGIGVRVGDIGVGEVPA
jgi:hypothetical protein